MENTTLTTYLALDHHQALLEEANARRQLARLEAAVSPRLWLATAMIALAVRVAPRGAHLIATAARS